jgi:hypothetical protein
MEMPWKPWLRAQLILLQKAMLSLMVAPPQVDSMAEAS